jgi:hypothetical protein
MVNTSTFDDLPAVIAEIAEVAGLDAAWTLAEKRGGRDVYIPHRAIAGHWLPELVGMEAAQKICAHYRVGDTGARILIPMASAARAKARFGEVLGAGTSNSQAAELLGVHERTVRRHRKRIRQTDSDQGDFF